jgi:hypothetical protein
MLENLLVKNSGIGKRISGKAAQKTILESHPLKLTG